MEHLASEGSVLFLDTELAQDPDEVGWGAARSGEAGLSCAVTIADPSGLVRIYDSSTLDALIETLEVADSVVTYNGEDFDLPVLAGVSGRSFFLRNHIDLLRVFTGRGRMAGWGLDATCQRNLGRGKTGNGKLALQLVAQGRWAELHTYCLDDVYLLRDLFHKVTASGIVIAPNGEEQPVCLSG